VGTWLDIVVVMVPLDNLRLVSASGVRLGDDSGVVYKLVGCDSWLIVCWSVVASWRA
jgi:hypothetical protein